MKPVLYLMLGLPGAGKTTTAKAIASITNALYVGSDETRLEKWQEPSFTQEEHDSLYKHLDQIAEYALVSGKNVVYDANLNRYIHRLEKYALAKRLGVDVVLCWVKVDRDMAKKRRLETQHPMLVPANEIPHEMFERIADIFEDPKDDERYIELDGTKIAKEYVAKKLGL